MPKSSTSNSVIWQGKVCGLAVLLLGVALLLAVSSLSGDTSYSYDALSQLTQEQSSRNGSYTDAFGYDSAGNPTTFKGATRAFNSNNQRTAFTYDASGNPTTYNSSTLAYDAENRLNDYDGAMAAGYTADGLRAWKEVGENRTYFLYSGGVPVCELDSSGNLIATNTFGPTGLLSRHTSGGSAFYTFDPQGSVAQVLDASGDVTSTQAYDAYGSALSGTTAGVPFGFGAQFGYYTDSETGLQLLGHRYYDPAEGRFLTRDPIGYAGGLNLYGYVGGNPVNAADPTGYCTDAPLRAFCNFVSGAGDAVSFGVTRRIRQWQDTDHEVNSSSGWYIGGEVSGMAVLAIATSGIGTGGGAAGVTGKVAWKAAEETAERELQKQGFQILGQQVSIKTSMGLRRWDYLVRGPNGDVIAIEVKQGLRGIRTLMQQRKDLEVAQRGGEIVGKNGQRAIDELGKLLGRTPTMVRWYK